VAEAFDFVEPILLQPLDMVVTVGQAANQTIRGRGVDGGPVSFAKSDGPAFLSVTTDDQTPEGTRGTIRLAPGPSDVGSYDVAISATGDGRSETAHIAVIVIADGDPAPIGPFDIAAPYQSVPLGIFPEDVAIGDLDGDGVPDIASADLMGGTLTLWFGRGDGSFLRRQTYRVRGEPISVAIGDIDRDGRADIAFADISSHVVSVLHGLGSSLFGRRTDYPTGSDPAYVVLVDLSGDGILDMVVANEDDNDISVLLGRTDGGFDPRVNYLVGAAPCQLSAGDVNADGRPDVVVVNEDGNSVSVLLGIGGGLLSAGVAYATGAQPRTVAIGDLNRDGLPDLAVPNFSGDTFSVLLGTGGGAFASHGEYATGPVPWGLALADFNQDGFLDVTTVNTSDGTFSVFPGDGSGTFPTRNDASVGVAPRTVRTADFNGDGRVDLVATNEGGDNCTVLLGNGDGTFGASELIAPSEPLGRVVMGRIDDDGAIDLAGVRLPTGLRIVFGGDGGGVGSTIAIETGEAVLDLVIGDWNGDGRADLAASHQSSRSLSIYLNEGQRRFAPPAVYDVGIAGFHLATGDWNADGHPDIAVGDILASQLLLAKGGPGGVFTTSPAIALAGTPRGFAVGDWNEDGVSDLAVAESNPNGFALYFGSAQGSLTPGPFTAATLPATSIALGDLDRDGRLEVATTESVQAVSLVSGALVVYRHDERGVPQLAYRREMGAVSAVRLADLNGDGYLDASVSRRGAIALFAGSRNGGLERRTDIGPAIFFPPVVGDWNGDGAPDLVVGNLDGLRLYRNRIRHAPPARPARAFLTPENRVVRFPAGKPTTCVEVEPLGDSFDLTEVDLTSLSMRSTDTGDVEEIAGTVGKRIATADRDRNGIAEFEVCFARASLQRLFSRLSGAVTVPVVVRGSIESGGTFEGSLDLHVVAGHGGPSRVSVAPNPMNPTATMTIVTGGAGPLRVRLFDASGRLVRTLLDRRFLPAGSHTLMLDATGQRARRLASGIYYYRVEGTGGDRTGRIAIVK
jgi:hypothetical protein